MKKPILVLLAVCLLTAFMVATVSAGEQTVPSPFPPVIDETTDPGVAFSEGSVPAEAGLTDGIRLPIHALVLSLWEHELTYDTQSAPFVWNALYYALSLYGQADDRAQLTEDALLLPSEVVHDFANALFANLNDLPPLPEENDFVSYDALTDTYHLSIGDFAETQLLPGALTQLANGSFRMEGTLTALENDAPLLRFHVDLQENDTMFGFSILDVSLY